MTPKCSYRYTSLLLLKIDDYDNIYVHIILIVFVQYSKKHVKG